MRPYDTFQFTHARSIYLVDLYDLLHNQRQRAVRTDWSRSFKTLMRWNQADTLQRVDGDDCILVMRNPSEWTMKHFEHDHLSELLRSAIVCGVSAMDRYFHDTILDNALGLLRRPEADVPRKFREIKLTLADAEAAVSHALRDRASGRQLRPRNTLKARLSDSLHRQTFQSPGEIETAMSMLGLGNVWGHLAQHMTGNANAIKTRLSGIVRRRNQIVHEGDLVRAARPQNPSMHNVVSSTVRDDLDWLNMLVNNVNNRVETEL